MKPPKIDYWEDGEEETLGSPSVLIHTCCHCYLRHIFTLEIKKYKDENYISMRSYSDWEGTEAMRYIEKLKTKAEKSKTKSK